MFESETSFIMLKLSVKEQAFQSQCGGVLKITLSKGIKSVLRLKCPYCLSTKFQKKGSWFSFSSGCDQCHYPYEREEGYFTGASWMINYTVTALTGLGSVAVLKILLFPELNTLIVISIASVLMIFFSAMMMPFSKALWLVIDHVLHPLSKDERNLNH